MTRALIIGGGVAGPVTAMALQRAGIDAVVYEAYAPTTEEVGPTSPSPPTASTRCARSAPTRRCSTPVSPPRPTCC